MIIDVLSNWRNRFEGDTWRIVFEALEKLGPDSPEGRTELMGDKIYMVVMSYTTRERADAILETHRRHIDIQMALSGSERLEWAHRDGLTIKTPYEDKTDVEFYQHPEAPMPAGVDIAPGLFALLYPEDAHMPGLKTGVNVAPVKKVVVKINVEVVGKTS